MADLPIGSDEGAQLVAVVNPQTQVELAVNSDGSIYVRDTNVAKSYGTWMYYAGTSGTVAVSTGQRVLSISCHATTAGSVTVNGGASIPVPATVGFSIEMTGILTAPTIVFTGTDSYFVEAVS